MKKLFGALYAIYGCAWLALASWIPNVSVALGIAALAAFCFLAAGLAFSSNRLLWRIVHVIFGATTLVLWVAGSAWFLAYLFGWIRTYDTAAAGPLLGGFIALVLTVPAIGYVRNLATWRRARAPGAASESERGPAYLP